MEHQHLSEDGSHYIVHDHVHSGHHYHPDDSSLDYVLLERPQPERRPQQVDIATAAFEDLGELWGFYGVWVSVAVLMLGAGVGLAIGEMTREGLGNVGAVIGALVAAYFIYGSWMDAYNRRKGHRNG